MPHTYENLRKKVPAPAENVRRCGDTVPLVYCVRSNTAADELVAILIKGSLGGLNVHSRGSTARANKLLGIPRGSLYLYAGRAFPDDFAHLCLLFGGALDEVDEDEDSFEEALQKAISSEMDVGARPFDSGALVATEPEKQLRLRWQEQVPEKDGQPDAKAYFDAHNITDITAWRDYFTRFLGFFFDRPEDYWHNAPVRSIDGARLGKGTDWRNWTFEVHSKPAIDLERACEVIVDEATATCLAEAVAWEKNTSPRVSEVLKKRPARGKPCREATRRAEELALETTGD